MMLCFNIAYKDLPLEIVPTATGEVNFISSNPSEMDENYEDQVCILIIHYL